MKRLLVFTLAMLTLILSLSSCGYSEAELTEARNAGYNEGHAAGYEEGRASATKEPEGAIIEEKVISYSKSYVIDTSHIAAASVSLGKGEIFAGRLNVKGAIVFYIRDFSFRKVVDAGRIEGEYVFSFDVKESGDYTLVFDDEEGHRIVHLEYNSPASLRDASVRP